MEPATIAPTSLREEPPGCNVASETESDAKAPALSHQHLLKVAAQLERAIVQLGGKFRSGPRV